MAALVVLSKSQHEVPFVEVSTPDSVLDIFAKTAGSAQSVGALRLEPRPLDQARTRGLAGSAALDRP